MTFTEAIFHLWLGVVTLLAIRRWERGQTTDRAAKESTIDCGPKFVTKGGNPS